MTRRTARTLRPATISMIALLAGLTLLDGICKHAQAALVYNPPHQWIDDEFLVSFYAGFSQSTVDSISVHFSCTSYEAVDDSLYLYRLPANTNESAIADSCAALGLPDVKSAHVNFVILPDDPEPGQLKELPESRLFDCSRVDDPEAPYQWYLKSDFLDVCPAWGITSGDTSVTIVVMDTGLDRYHEDFSADVGGRITLVSFVGTSEPIDLDVFGHGTAVTGVIGASQNNQTGISGIAPSAPLLIAKVAYYSPDAGNAIYDLNAISRAFNYIGAMAANRPEHHFIVNCSWGAYENANSAVVAQLRSDIDKVLYNHNVLIVAAAGNGVTQWKLPGGERAYVAYPAAFSGDEGPFYSQAVDDIVVAVGGLSARDPEYPDVVSYYIAPTNYSSWAATDTCNMIVDVAAPGGDFGYAVRTTVPEALGGYGDRAGTSYAAACISGIAALMWSATPTLNAEQVKEGLRAWAKYYSQPLLPASSLAEPYHFETTWHRYHPFMRSYEGYCPFPGAPEELPIWPTPNEKKTNGTFDYDTWGSVALGSGMPDAAAILHYGAGRSVYRIAGGIMTESVTCSDADIIQVYGDLTIPDGITLRIEPKPGDYQVAFVLNDYDRMHAGDDTNRVEIVVASGGSLDINGADIAMRAYRYASEQDSCWSGLTLEPGATYGRSNAPRDLVVEGCQKGVQVASSNVHTAHLAVSGTDEALHLFESMECEQLDLAASGTGCACEDGVVLQITGTEASSIAGVGATARTGMEVRGACSIMLDGLLTISGWQVGVASSVSSELSWDGSLAVNNCAVGIDIATGTDIQFGPTGSITITGNQGGIGISQASGTSVSTSVPLGAGSCAYGVLIDNAVDVSLTGPVTLSENVIHGAYVDSSLNVELNGSAGTMALSNNGQDGLRAHDSQVVLLSATMQGNAGAGLGAHGVSNAYARDCLFESNMTGVIITDDSAADLGEQGVSLGSNYFKLNATRDCVNLNNNVQSLADGNHWWYRGVYDCPPNASRILGWISTMCQ